MFCVLAVVWAFAAQAQHQEAVVDGVDDLIGRALLTWAPNSTDLDGTAYAKVAQVPMQAPPVQRGAPMVMQRVMEQPMAPQAKVFPLSVMIPPTTEEILARVEAKKAATQATKAVPAPASAPAKKVTATKIAPATTAIKDAAKAASKPRVTASKPTAVTNIKPATVKKTDASFNAGAQKAGTDKQKAEAEKKKKAEAEKKRKQQAATKRSSGDGPLGGLVAVGGGLGAAYYAATNKLPDLSNLDAEKISDALPKSGESWGRRRGSSPFPKEADPFWDKNNPEMLAQGSDDPMSAIVVAVMGLALGCGVTTLALRVSRGTAAAAERW